MATKVPLTPHDLADAVAKEQPRQIPIRMRYVGGTAEVIAQLRKEGHNVGWFDRLAPTRMKDEGTIHDKCSYFSLYWLEGDIAYTINHDGSKYLERRKVSKPEPKPCHYCAGCKTRFYEVEKALAHRDEVKK